MTTLSIVSPCYNERESLSSVYEDIVSALHPLGISWEWVIIDDHSTDETFQEIAQLGERDPRVRGIRLAQKAGSHVAIFCGLDYVESDCVAVLMADLQDPADVLVDMIGRWQEGFKVVWASRTLRGDKNLFNELMARIYYFLLRRIIRINQVPISGTDLFLIDCAALEVVRAYRDRNVSIFSLLSWLDFPSTNVFYERRDRRFGESKWSFGRRAKLFIDTITGFSHFPIRAMSLLGALVAACGFLAALYLSVSYFYTAPQPGWTSVTVLILIIGGLIMLMLGVLGEYVARVLDEVRPRPRYIIERFSNDISNKKYADSLILAMHRNQRIGERKIGPEDIGAKVDKSAPPDVQKG